MAVASPNFGGVKLSGNDAKVFVKQIESGKRSDQTDKAIARGRELLREMNKSGSVIVSGVKRG